MDISLIFQILFKIIDEVRNIGTTKKTKLIKRDADLDKLYNGITELLDKFNEVVDNVLKILSKLYPYASIVGRKRVKITELQSYNRKLFEINSEMKIIFNKFQMTLKKEASSEIDKIINNCLQIISVEYRIGFMIASEVHQSMLPFDINKTINFWAARKKGDEGYEYHIFPLNKLPSDNFEFMLPHPLSLPYDDVEGSKNEDYYVFMMCDYFNRLLLLLRNCRARISKEIEELKN